MPLHSTGSFGDGVTARLTAVQAVDAAANGPGEVAGPGLRIAVRLSNGTSRTIALSDVVVTVADAQGTPGVQMSQSGSAPFHGDLDRHGTADSVYVFTIPANHRDPVTVELSYSSAAPVVLFVGDAP